MKSGGDWGQPGFLAGLDRMLFSFRAASNIHFRVVSYTLNIKIPLKDKLPEKHWLHTSYAYSLQLARIVATILLQQTVEGPTTT